MPDRLLVALNSAVGTFPTFSLSDLVCSGGIIMIHMHVTCKLKYGCSWVLEVERSICSGDVLDNKKCLYV